MVYPFTCEPRLKERVWGGRTLAALYGKALPPDVPIGESWEIADRPGDESIIVNGPLAGRSLRWLMEHHAAEVLGAASPAPNGRFPLLCKILDARETLSLQVHPPAHLEPTLGGEPKTEMWYIADAAPGAELYVGLKPGVTRDLFEARINSGDVASLFHRITVRRGDTMFLPSGRVHAISAGLVIFEIQQNSDTTYRVFDWNRLGLDGRPRELHVAQSLASIDFADVEPGLVESEVIDDGGIARRRLVSHPLFTTDLLSVSSHGTSMTLDSRLRVAAVVQGHVTIIGAGESLALVPGQFCVVPAAVQDVRVELGAASELLLVSV